MLILEIASGLIVAAFALGAIDTWLSAKDRRERILRAWRD